jgi:hypothetical protein
MKKNLFASLFVLLAATMCSGSSSRMSQASAAKKAFKGALSAPRRLQAIPEDAPLPELVNPAVQDAPPPMPIASDSIALPAFSNAGSTLSLGFIAPPVLLDLSLEPSNDARSASASELIQNNQQTTALVPHNDHYTKTTMQVYHPKPSEFFIKRSGTVDPMLGFVRYFDEHPNVRAQDFYDKTVQEQEPLPMLEGPTSSETALAPINEALSPASANSNAAVTNFLISTQNQNNQLMLDCRALDENRIQPALLLLANSSINSYKAANDLIERGAQAKYSSACSENPLHLACAQGHDQVVLRLLEESDIDINQRIYKGGLRAPVNGFQHSVILQETPLMIAVKNQQRACVILMIIAGSKLEKTDQDGLTAHNHADRAYDLELKKIPQGDIKKARGIINLFENHNYIERFLTLDEIQLLRQYFLKKYPELESIAGLTDQAKVIICRYIGFQQWDNKTLMRAFSSTGNHAFAKMCTPEPTSQAIIPALGDPTKQSAASSAQYTRKPLPVRTESEQLEVVKTALSSLKSLVHSAQQTEKFIKRKAAFIKALHDAFVTSQDLLEAIEEEQATSQLASQTESQFELPSFDQ